MTSIPVATRTAPITAIDPRLAAAVQSLPPDQQRQAMAQLQSMTPAQQQQLLAQLSAQASQQQTAAASATPAATSATMAASALEPPNRMATILKNVAIFGGIGAALGFGASFLTLPIVGQVAAPIAAAVGGAVGVVAGLIKGIMGANKQQAAYDEAVAAEQAQQAPMPGDPIDPAAPDADPGPDAAPGDAGTVPSATRFPKVRRYTVTAGDNLSVIADRHGLTWQQLYKANREAVGSNPHLIHPGLRLRIPAA